jgi:AcrR family transcriptional regulator
MSSRLSPEVEAASKDDRTAKARIRDAAIDCIAEHGVAGTTARKVAALAGVSPGLVIHHFDSMDGLRLACDQYVVGAIRERKEAAAAAGPAFDVLASLRTGNIGQLGRYLARVLVDDSPAVTRLVDDLVADAEDYMQRFVEAGMARPSDDPRARAAVLMIWGLGALVLHDHVQRLLGVDLTDRNVDAATLAGYARPAYEILGGGMLTDTVASNLQESLTHLTSVESPPAPETSKGTP